MKISYNPKHDIMYIKFSEAKIVNTIEVDEGVLIDYGEIVGIEVINASIIFHGKPLDEITIKIEESAVL